MPHPSQPAAEAVPDPVEREIAGRHWIGEKPFPGARLGLLLAVVGTAITAVLWGWG